MSKKILVLFSVFFLALAVNAQDNDEAPELSFKYGGVYTAWGQMQQDFKLGNGWYKDEYVVQMLRLGFTFGYGDYVKAITRFDLGQGWWGVDNVEPTYRPGGSYLFDNKDANYYLHVDHAYLWFKIPGTPVTSNVGRFKWKLGNQMVLDNNLDGISASIHLGEDVLTLGWAKVSENASGLSDHNLGADARDANLITGQFSKSLGSTDIEVFGAFYDDASTDDNSAYLIDGLYYNRPRFTPQVTQLIVGGLAGTTKMGKLSLEYEGNFLTGKDDIANTTHAGPLNTSDGTATDAFKYDINNGDLSGYNIFLRANYAVTDALTVGIFGGMGSGDDDPTGGEGNVNKLRTSGFFYLTEVWEDSIMPDEEGITPQGLGAPNIRAYRELENTTAVQVNASIKLLKQLKLFGSFTYLTATQDVYAWNPGTGVDLNTSASDLGWEVDLKIDYSLYKNLTASFRAGYFTPGDAAKYLINGTDQWDRSPWELKTTITFKF